MTPRSPLDKSGANSARRTVRSPYHPFRTKAVECYERPLIPTLPAIMPAWRWWQAVAAVGLLLLGARLWVG
jgi:hypothetical protein